MKKNRTARPLLRAAALSAGALLAACGSGAGETPLPGNPKGSQFDENAAKEDEVLISGTIVMGDPEVPPDATAVFVSVRGDAGPPIAAKKLPLGPFPMAFELTKADMMRGEQPIPDQLMFKVSLDADGNAMTKEDLPQHQGAYKKGSMGVEVTVRKLLPPPGNPKGSMYDDGLVKPTAEPKLDP